MSYQGSPVLCTVHSKCQINVSSIDLQTFLLLLYFQVEALTGQKGCGLTWVLFFSETLVILQWDPSLNIPQCGLANGLRQVLKGEDGCFNEGEVLCSWSSIGWYRFCADCFYWDLERCEKFRSQLYSWEVSESDWWLHLGQDLPDSLWGTSNISRWETSVFHGKYNII